MILGTLSLIQKRGVFYSQVQVVSEDRFSININAALQPNEGLTVSDIPDQYQITPVEELGNTDYINAIFEDGGKAQYPYDITVWLLVEESIMDM